jgi:hypothetical protein
MKRRTVPTMVSLPRATTAGLRSLREKINGAGRSDFILGTNGHMARNMFQTRSLFCNSATAMSLGWVRRQSAHEHIAAANIQAVRRGNAARKLLQLRHAQATSFQAAARGFLGRKAESLRERRTTKMQAITRGWAVRREYGEALQVMAAERKARAVSISRTIFVISKLKPRAKVFMRTMRTKKEEVNRELRRREIAAKFRDVSAKAYIKEHRSCNANGPICTISEVGECDDTGKMKIVKKKSWTLRWGKLELSKSRVAELTAEIERVRKEWLGGKIVRRNDGSFAASFSPGDPLENWFETWMHPNHFSHGGRFVQGAHLDGPVVTLRSLAGEEAWDRQQASELEHERLSGVDLK